MRHHNHISDRLEPFRPLGNCAAYGMAILPTVPSGFRTSKAVPSGFMQTEPGVSLGAAEMGSLSEEETRREPTSRWI